jgi:hypothetical protein
VQPIPEFRRTWNFSLFLSYTAMYSDAFSAASAG